MPNYMVKAPDGRTITIQGPAGASQQEIIAQAQKLYVPTPASARVNKPKPAAPDPQQVAALQRYNTMQQMVVGKAKTPEERAIRQRVFDSDPRVQAIRKAAGLATVSTRQQEVQGVARRAVASRPQTDQDRARALGTAIGSQMNSRLDSTSAGIARGLFGIPERLAAAYLRYAPTALTGNDTNASYDNILQVVRSANDAKMAAHPGYALTGEIGSGFVGGSTAGKIIQGGARRLASVVPQVAPVANFLESLVTLRKGQKAANAAKIAATGAAAGGAQAAGTGNNVVEGAVTGAVAAPAVLGAGYAVNRVIGRPLRDVLRVTGGEQILRRLTTATRDQLERRAAQYRADTGAEPTVFEILPLADRNKILQSAVVGKDNVVEQASNAIRRRANNLGREMSTRARQILEPNRTRIQQQITQDLTNARGGQLAQGDADLIQQAMDNPSAMRRLRDTEARAIMAPHENTPVVANLEDLIPSAAGPNGQRVALDPEVATKIRGAAGTLRQRAQNAGVTVGEITDMMSTLREELKKGGIEGGNAQRAIDHLQDVLDTYAPDAGAAARQMTDAYAARSRMLEGMKEGNQTRLQEDIYPDSRAAARKVQNAYETPEGASGRTLGQGNRIVGDLGGSPDEALRATIRQSRGSSTRALVRNIGQNEAELLGNAARAQDESAQALAAASNKAQSGAGEGADAETLVSALASLHPSTFITTKTNAVRKLIDMTYIPESRARTIVDMIFSQDPAMVQRALRAVGNEPNGARFIQSLAAVVGQQSNAVQDLPDLPADAPAPMPQDATGEELPPVDEGADPNAEIPDDGASPYDEELQRVYDEENPDLIELVQRVKGQESGGSQFDEQGRPLTSSAGAIGVMQVMPDTAPEAAQLAGLPWDPEAYRNDPKYNELLGIAYLSELLRKYDGNVDVALAAYNAGPGRVDDALAMGDRWLDHLPAETQDYVARVG